jgi:2-polyprenyl-3-methyl-5-hydroxy-6-metoxy-1,4-benzoquinol methylase
MFDEYWNGSNDEPSNRPADIVLGWPESYPFLIGYRRVIDLGCGIGNMVDWLNMRGHDAYGITYQQIEVDYAQKLNRPVFLGDILEIAKTTPIDHFDAFVMWDSLEHSIAPYVALKNAHAIVRNRGRGLIFIPNRDWIECDYHIIVPNIRQMKHLLKMTGFQIDEVLDMGNEQAVYKVTVVK